MTLKFKQQDIPVTEANPFEHDALKRKAHAEPLCEFLANSPGQYVLAIDSPWGSGKTTFVRMCEALLKKRGHATISFNAWTSDFTGDPLVALLGELDGAIEKLDQDGTAKKTAKNLLKKSAKIASRLTQVALPIAARVATSGLLDVEALRDGLSDFAEKAVEEAVIGYQKDKASLVQLQELLGKIVGLIAPSGRKGPLIVFIDELDRCRPTYAIELLERVKHIFDIPGIVFVLSIDKEQLCSAIKAVYGAEFNAEGYLRRFIDADFRLPRGDVKAYSKVVLNALGAGEYLAQRPSGSSDLQIIGDECGVLMAAFGMSLREVQQCLGRICIALQATPWKHKLFRDELILLAILRDVRPQTYKEFTSGIIGSVKVMECLRNAPFASSATSDMDWPITESVLIACALEMGQPEKILLNYHSAAENVSLPDQDRRHAQAILKIVGDIQNRFHGGSGMKHIIKRLEFAQSFDFSADLPKNNLDS